MLLRVPLLLCLSAAVLARPHKKWRNQGRKWTSHRWAKLRSPMAGDWTAIPQVDRQSLPSATIPLPRELSAASISAFGSKPPPALSFLLQNGFLAAPLLLHLDSSLPAPILDWAERIGSLFNDFRRPGLLPPPSLPTWLLGSDTSSEEDSIEFEEWDSDEDEDSSMEDSEEDRDYEAAVDALESAEDKSEEAQEESNSKGTEEAVDKDEDDDEEDSGESDDGSIEEDTGDDSDYQYTYEYTYDYGDDNDEGENEGLDEAPPPLPPIAPPMPGVDDEFPDYDSFTESQTIPLPDTDAEIFDYLDFTDSTTTPDVTESTTLENDPLSIN